MTHDILQSDIDLATRLRDDQRPDEEIIRALAHRGIDPSKAAQLVDDLRAGRKVSAQAPLPMEFTRARRSHGRSTLPESPSAGSPAGTPPPGEPLPTAHRPKRSTLFRRIVVVLVSLALVIVGIVLFQRHQMGAGSWEASEATATKPSESPRRSPTAPAEPASATQPGLASSLALELQPDGLRIGGNLVTRHNVLPAVANLLGTPTRTNQLSRTGTMIYAYDRQGLLIYSQPGGGPQSIVLDCEATGGVNGTTAPFGGILKIGNRVIGPDMDAATLTSIKELELKTPGTGESIWNGRYHGLDLVFAYLRSPLRPSLIQIDLK